MAKKEPITIDASEYQALMNAVSILSEGIADLVERIENLDDSDPTSREVELDENNDPFLEEVREKVFEEYKDEDYKEIFVLKEGLEEAGIPFSFLEKDDGFQIMYPDSENCICSVSENAESYGSDSDLLEIEGLLSEEERINSDNKVGWIKADEVFERIVNDFDSENDVDSGVEMENDNMEEDWSDMESNFHDTEYDDYENNEDYDPVE